MINTEDTEDTEDTEKISNTQVEETPDDYFGQSRLNSKLLLCAALCFLFEERQQFAQL